MSRFLDVSKVVELLERAPADDDERALVAAIDAEPKLKAQVLQAKGKAVISNELQQKVIIASTKAAAARVAADARLGPKVTAATDAVVGAGGSKDEALGLVQQAVLDEGFAWPEDPEDFDEAFLAETLESLVALAKVDTDLVEGWVDEFVKQVEGAARPLRLAVADALLEAAWADGPQPIAAEHVDDAMDALAHSVASSELEKAGGALVDFLGFLAKRQLVGAVRLGRLTEVAKAAAAAPELGDDEEEEDDASDEEA